MATHYFSVAETAKWLRDQLKRRGIKPLSVRSRSFSMGTSIDVVLPKDTCDGDLELVQTIARQTTYGRFDAMLDSYECIDRTITWNGITGRPGSKYTHVTRSWN